MGNCIDRQRVGTWVDDEEWDSVLKEEEEEEATHGKGEGGGAMMRSRSCGDQVKVKITKKQLDKFLEGGMSVEQVLAQILNHGYVRTPTDQQQQHSHWRPALNTIAE